MPNEKGPRSRRVALPDSSSSRSAYLALYKSIVAASTRRAEKRPKDEPYVHPINVFENIHDAEREALKKRVFDEATRAVQQSVNNGFEPIPYTPSTAEIEAVKKAEKTGSQPPYIPSLQLTLPTDIIKTSNYPVALFGDAEEIPAPGQTGDVSLHRVVLAATRTLPHALEISEPLLLIDFDEKRIRETDGQAAFVSTMSIAAEILTNIAPAQQPPTQTANQ